MVQLLLNEGAKVKAKTSSDRTPLDDAKQEGNKEIMKLLVQAGRRRGQITTFCCF